MNGGRQQIYRETLTIFFTLGKQFFLHCKENIVRFSEEILHFGTKGLLGTLLAFI